MKNKQLNTEQIGSRLAIVIAKFDGGIVQAAKLSGVSTYTLRRYIDDKSPMPLVKMALLCNSHDININWLLYGD